MPANTMLILFDIDDTLVDHREAERTAASGLHRHIGSAESPEPFPANWSAALERQDHLPPIINSLDHHE